MANSSLPSSYKLSWDDINMGTETQQKCLISPIYIYIYTAVWNERGSAHINFSSDRLLTEWISIFLPLLYFFLTPTHFPCSYFWLRKRLEPEALETISVGCRTFRPNWKLYQLSILCVRSAMAWSTFCSAGLNVSVQCEWQRFVHAPVAKNSTKWTVWLLLAEFPPFLSSYCIQCSLRPRHFCQFN